jgi:hypothetical protein
MALAFLHFVTPLRPQFMPRKMMLLLLLAAVMVGMQQEQGSGFHVIL